MKHNSKEKMKEEKHRDVKGGEAAELEQLLDTLLQQKEQLFDEVFLTKDDKAIIDAVGKEHQQKVREALLNKGVLIKKLIGRFQRLSADYTNFQKRTPKQIADATAYEKERIIKTLLPVLDNFEHTLQSTHSAENTDVIVRGVRIIYDQMLDILKSHDVEQIKAVGEKFDPSLHQAVTQRSEGEQQDDVVLEEFQTGYKLNGRVIRPSKVVVNKLATEETICRQMPTEEKGQQETGPSEQEE